MCSADRPRDHHMLLALAVLAPCTTSREGLLRIGACSPPIDALVVPAQRAHDDCRGDPVPVMLRRRRVVENRRQPVGRF